MRHVFILLWILCSAFACLGQDTLPGTDPLPESGRTPAEMIAGMRAYLLESTQQARVKREATFKPDVSSAEAFARWQEARRERLRRIIGAADARLPIHDIELVTTSSAGALIADAGSYRVYQVRWPVLPGVEGEGLLLEPHAPRAAVVALPDADNTPEQLAGLAEGLPPAAQFARRLAEAGCRVIVPVLIDRADTWSGNPRIAMTNQPHREFLYRAAFQMGRHLIGYEVKKVRSAVDWLASNPRVATTSAPAGAPSGERSPIGVMGYGEGGLIAFYAAAVDTRIDAAVVSGCFGPREDLWRQPIYRNVWTLLRDFGDAEILSLIAPRTAIVEAAREPDVKGPPAPRDKRSGGAVGRLETPRIEAIREEFERATRLLGNPDLSGRFELVEAEQGGLAPVAGPQTMAAFLHALGIHGTSESAAAPKLLRQLPDASARMRRQFEQLRDDTQRLVHEAPERRQAFWAKADPSSLERWQESTRGYREYFHQEFLGRLPPPTAPLKARTRPYVSPSAQNAANWRGWEVRVDVYPGVFAAGVLLVPSDLKSGERRPVVVCQHGLEGTPVSVIEEKDAQAGIYHAFARRLVERGYVVYAPQNPYTGGDDFRLCQRLANPLGLTLYSFMVAQHARTLEWLATLPFVDADRIGFYGLSYGGKTAMRIPAVVPGYALSICSGDFNEWTWKTTSHDFFSSFLFTNEWEIPEFDQGNTFGYAEMAALIAPRPFMVERGHNDPVGIDEWVGYEYAKVRRLYDGLGVGDRTRIEFFPGRHEIHGVGTFVFLDRFLRGAPGASSPHQ